MNKPQSSLEKITSELCANTPPLTIEAANSGGEGGKASKSLAPTEAPQKIPPTTREALV
jgi:hypothetical protein